MWEYSRSRDRFKDLLLSRRNLFVALDDAKTAVLSATDSMIVIYVGTWTEHRSGQAVLAHRVSGRSAWRSNGWDLNAAIDLLEELGMAVKLDLRNMPRDNEGRLVVESDSDYVTARDLNGNATLRPVPRFGRDIRESIWAFIAENPEGVTVGEIAKAVNRKKTPWLRAKIESMVQDDYLLKVEVEYRSNMPAFLYYCK